MGTNGGMGHVSTDGVTDLKMRADRYGIYEQKVGECLWYGDLNAKAIKNGADIVKDLLVDDGVPDRGHRR